MSALSGETFKKQQKVSKISVKTSATNIVMPPLSSETLGQEGVGRSPRSAMSTFLEV